MIPPKMCMPDEEYSGISIAEIYIGPRPPHVPKAEPAILNVKSFQSSPSPSPLYVVDARSNKKAIEGFVNATLDDFPSMGVLADADAGDIPVADDLASFQLEPGEHLPTPELEEHKEHVSSPQSDSSGRRSASSCSITNSLSQDLHDQTPPLPLSPSSPRKKKGECYLCSKVNRVHTKETCLVCDAKYCSTCVTKAMGSMPEGRKCSKCVGQPICDSKRQKLGKPTRLLTRLLSKLEVQQIMKAEIVCLVNQLRPEQLIVNGRQLTSKEFAELLGCKYPPTKLKPGSYWYDPVCGFWGKEGKKPDKIISVNLSFGRDPAENASAGNTRVFINGREITKVELKMLKFAGVQCHPETRLWVDADGSYKEEGHNHYHGKIWEKASTRYICKILSLPVPNVHTGAPELSKAPAYSKPQTTFKILLVGPTGSGTSTIIKQVKLLHNNQFSSKELEDLKALIHKNVYRYLIILLEARERFEDEESALIKELQENTASTSSGDAGIWSAMANVYTLPARKRKQADWFLETDARGELEKHYPGVTREDAEVIEELWNDPAIQATYRRRAELHMLPEFAGHFLEKVVLISSIDYMPEHRDLLYAEGVTQDLRLAEVEFCVEEDGASGPYPNSLEQSLSETRYHLIRMSGHGITDDSKLFKMFDDVGAVIFCIALDSYQQMWSDGESPPQNKMLLSRSLFESMLKHPSFKGKPVILYLNKYDSFEKKILSVPLRACEWFSDFDPVKSSSQTPAGLAQQAYSYIAHMFKKQFEMVNPSGGKLFTYQLKALEPSSVSAALQYVKEILVWEEVKRLHHPPSTSFYTTESSSFVIEAQRS